MEESEEKAATNESEGNNSPGLIADLKKQVKPAEELPSPQANSCSNERKSPSPFPSTSPSSQDVPVVLGKVNGDIILPKLHGVSITPINCSGNNDQNETPTSLKEDSLDCEDNKMETETTPVLNIKENCASSSQLPASLSPSVTVRKVVKNPLTAKKSKLGKKKNVLKKKVSAAKPHSTGDKLVKYSKSEEVADSESFQIKYTGTKKPSKPFSKIKKPSLKGNPFSPSLKRVNDENCEEFAPEYAQYLGLQPIVKFKCSNCETSTFQSMSDLNAHKAGCKKLDRAPVPSSSVLPESKSTNIKLTRKVFLCSACGTYYENWNLFLHMREAHRRYICLTCLGMFSVPEKLADHLKQKHGATCKELDSSDQITNTFHQAYYALCLNCDRVFSEEDKLCGHKCLSKKTSEGESSSALQSTALDQSVPTETAHQSPVTRASSKRLSKKNSGVQRHPKHTTTTDTHPKSKEEGETNVSDSQSRVGIMPLPPSTSLISSEGETHLPTLPDTPVEAPVPVPPPEPQLESSLLTSLPPPPSHPLPPKPTRNKKAKKGKTLSRRKKVSRPKVMPLPMTDVTIKTEPEDDIALNQEDPLLGANESQDTEPQTKAASPAMNHENSPTKITINPAMFKKLRPGMESDNDSDDSQKLSLVVDESANNSESELKAERPEQAGKKPEEVVTQESNDLALAGEDVPAMALTLDDKIDNVPVQTVVKECVRTSCLSCNYCLHASKIAVNGKYLAIHLLSEHRYRPVKNETPDDVVLKMKSSLEVLSTMFFNTDSYDNTDSSAFVPFNQDVSYDCLQCVFKCYTPKELFTHKKKMHTKSLMLCIMCKCNFSSYSELLCHLCPGHYDPEITFVNVNMNFRCCLCRIDSIPSSFRLMVHLRKSHHTCDICLESCADQQKLSTHLWKHKTNHSCYRCGIAYASKPDITKHLFWKHGHESVLCKKCLQKKWPHVYHFCIPPSSFICEECNATFSKAVALKVHKRIHGNDYPYACTQCEKKFVSKKLLQRHEDRHNNPPEEPVPAQIDPKEEIINVTDVFDGKEEEAKEPVEKTEVRDKSHKKHKKDKKEKKMVDVVDELPPLNLSSDSDSSDVEGSKPKSEESAKSSKEPSSEQIPKDDPAQADVERSVMNAQPGSVESTLLEELLTACLKEVGEDVLDAAKPPEASSAETSNLVLNEKFESIPEPEVKHVEGIWENFYKRNPVNVNLPYPLCAMRTEDAYAIITHDHDYCDLAKEDNAVQNTGTSAPDSKLLDDKMEETNDLIPKEETDEKPEVAPEVSDDKKKSRSPKKKLSKTENENSSSSSDSSSDSDSSDCTCGTNCSCSSSSSNSSSSSSSDSDTSGAGEKAESRRKKKRERRSKTKPEPEPPVELDQPKVTPEPEIEDESPKQPSPPRQPIDPPIRESELETDETSTDEEFYDRQPQRLANQLLAEKRSQLAAAVAPVNNGNASPTVVMPTAEIPAPPQVTPLVETPGKTPKHSKSRKRRRQTAPPKMRVAVPKPNSSSQPVEPYLPQFVGHLTPSKPFPAYHPSPIIHETPKSSVHTPTGLSNSTPPIGGNPAMSSESEKSRSSKRRRIPNKFYGYSSGEEEDKSPVPKVKKENVQQPVQPYKPSPIHHPPLTPRIQLNVSKTVIRKPNYMKNRKTPKVPPITISTPDPEPLRPSEPVRLVTMPVPPPTAPAENVPSASGSLPPKPPPPHVTVMPVGPHVLHGPGGPSGAGKTDKDVYCYCRCPYDEVSEMIACDDENCKIEWFHFECVGILVPPRGQWYCPGCRKARGLPT